MSRYYKILPEDLNCRGFQYHEGLNIDTNKIDEYQDSYGLHFADKKHILKFCGYGTIIAEVELPEDAVVYHSPFGNQSKADRIILKNLRPLWSVDTIEALIREGVEFESFKSFMLGNAAGNGLLDIVKYLEEQGADIHAGNDYALRLASQYGHLSVVKYLVEHGADIHAYDDYTLRIASANGHLDIVRYLVEQGADIHNLDDEALQEASVHGYFEVVKLLIANGANPHARRGYAIRYAKTPEIKEYLKSLS